MRKLSAFFLIMVLLGIATGTCASLYVISDTLRDKIDIISTSPEVMHLEYIDGEELGGEAREVLEGKWEEFGLRLINRSPEGADPWGKRVDTGQIPRGRKRVHQLGILA